MLEIPPAGEEVRSTAISSTSGRCRSRTRGPSGADKGQGGKYLILPPGYADPVPEGYIPLQPDTFGGYALLRSNLKSHSDADVAKSVAYGKRIKVYPLSQAANPPATSVHRRSGRHVRLRPSATMRASSIVARPHRAERAVAATRPRDDRSAQVARHREGQALQSGRQDQGRARNWRPRGAGLARGKI